MSRAGIAAGLPLLAAAITLRVMSAYENSGGDPIAVSWTLAGVAALIIGVAGVIVLINRRRLSGAQARRESIETVGGGRWLADVTIGRHSVELLGADSAVKARTFALVIARDGMELWTTRTQSLARIERTRIRAVEAIPTSWLWSGASSISLELHDLSEPILVDVVGPLFGTLPASKAQQDSIVRALTSSGLTLS